jgi:hypothetical protein
MLAVPDNEVGRRAIQIVDRIYADDLELARSLINSLRGALPAMIEDDLLRWRSGRLADLGFVAWEEAMRLLRPLDLKTARDQPASAPSATPLHTTTSLVALGLRAGLLRRALAVLTPAQQGERAREFTLLVNELMSAQRFEPGDIKLQERAFRQAEATIGLGLELLATGLTDAAEVDAFLAGRIAAIGLRGVFRVGYGPLDKLRRAALALHREGHVSVSRIGSLLDRPWGPALAALATWYPELPLETSSSGVRPIAGLKDLARATELIAQAGALAALTFTGCAVDPAWVTRADEPERLSLGDLVRTALVHAHLPGTSGVLAPLTAGDLAMGRRQPVEGRPPGPRPRPRPPRPQPRDRRPTARRGVHPAAHPPRGRARRARARRRRHGRPHEGRRPPHDPARRRVAADRPDQRHGRPPRRADLIAQDLSFKGQPYAREDGACSRPHCDLRRWPRPRRPAAMVPSEAAA